MRSAPVEKVTWNQANEFCKSPPIASLKPNSWSLHDTPGKVAAWTGSGAGPCPSGPVKDPQEAVEKLWNEKLRAILVGGEARRGSGACPSTEEQRSQQPKGPQPEGSHPERSRPVATHTIKKSHWVFRFRVFQQSPREPIAIRGGSGALPRNRRTSMRLRKRARCLSLREAQIPTPRTDTILPDHSVSRYYSQLFTRALNDPNHLIFRGFLRPRNCPFFSTQKFSN